MTMTSEWIELVSKPGRTGGSDHTISIWAGGKNRQIYLPEKLVAVWNPVQLAVFVNETQTQLRLIKVLAGRKVAVWKNIKYKGRVVNCRALVKIPAAVPGHYRYELKDDVVTVYLAEEGG